MDTYTQACADLLHMAFPQVRNGLTYRQAVYRLRKVAKTPRARKRYKRGDAIFEWMGKNLKETIEHLISSGILKEWIQGKARA